MKGLNLKWAMLFSSLALCAAYASDTSQMICGKDDWGGGNWPGTEASSPSSTADDSDEANWKPESDDSENDSNPSLFHPKVEKEPFNSPQ
jgi:hypothetical protein